MQRRDFLKTAAVAVGAACAVSALAACGDRVSESAKDSSKGQPWRCSTCGYLTRDDKDLSKTACPKCGQKAMKKITEEEMKKYLEEEEKKKK